MKPKEYRTHVDWKHVGNILFFLEDAVGWFYFWLALIILISAPSWVAALALLAVVTFKGWAINWERVHLDGRNLSRGLR